MRPTAAAAGGRGPGVGSRARGAEEERAEAVDAGDRAAAGPDGEDVDLGQAHRVTGDLAAEAQLRFASGDEADVGRRAAHVEGEQVAVARQRSEAGRPDHAG